MLIQPETDIEDNNASQNNKLPNSNVSGRAQPAGLGHRMAWGLVDFRGSGSRQGFRGPYESNEMLVAFRYEPRRIHKINKPSGRLANSATNVLRCLGFQALLGKSHFPRLNTPMHIKKSRTIAATINRTETRNVTNSDTIKVTKKLTGRVVLEMVPRNIVTA